MGKGLFPGSSTIMRDARFRPARRPGPGRGTRRAGLGPGPVRGRRTAQTGMIHSTFMMSGHPRHPDTATFRNPSGSCRRDRRVGVTGPGKVGDLPGLVSAVGWSGPPRRRNRRPGRVVIPGRPPQQPGSWCAGPAGNTRQAAPVTSPAWPSTTTAGQGSRREHPPGRPGYTPRTVEQHNGRLPRVGGMTCHRERLHPVPTPTPSLRVTGQKLPPHGTHPPVLPCGHPRCRGARHHAYRSDP
ncbi:hypothetical protein MED15_00463 [Micromonospora noduli]|uniref:Uncharacterized protein n=1 Tax=Micromonospora noduli TaxID=709876 RepID=A0ABX9D9V3_9ACTN|nr:hypothetical protein MED15_00463 [Micromonospora noduli]